MDHPLREMLLRALTYWPEDDPEQALEDVLRQARELDPGEDLTTGRLIFLSESGRTSTRTYCTGRVHVAVYEAWGAVCGPADVTLERCSAHPCRFVEIL